MSQEDLVAGRYRFLRVLGRGGFSDVYLAEDVRLGNRKVAIKRMATHLLHDPERVEKFKQEADIVGRLTGTNIARAYDYGRATDGRYFIVLEYVEGKTFHEILKKEGPLAIKRCLHIGIQLLDALEEAHDLGIIHRDLKPKNIILAKQRLGDLVKVLDFGVARILNPEEDGNDWTLVGTASYMAPEQAQGKAISPASDLYSVGVLLYHALTGRPPFISKEDPVAVMIHHATTPVRPMREARPDLHIPEELDQIILKVLAKKPNQRYQSAEEFRNQLEMQLKNLQAASAPVKKEQKQPHISITIPDTSQDLNKQTLSWETDNQPPQPSTNAPPKSGTLHAHLPPPPMIQGQSPTPTLGLGEELAISPFSLPGQIPNTLQSTNDYEEEPQEQQTKRITAPNISAFAEPEGEPFSPIHDSFPNPNPDTDAPFQIKTEESEAQHPDEESSHNQSQSKEDEQLLLDLGSLRSDRASGREESTQNTARKSEDTNEERGDGIHSVDTTDSVQGELPSTVDLRPDGPPPNKATHPMPGPLPSPMLDEQPLPNMEDKWDLQETKQTSIPQFRPWQGDNLDEVELHDPGEDTIAAPLEDSHPDIDMDDIDDPTMTTNMASSTEPHVPAAAFDHYTENLAQSAEAESLLASKTDPSNPLASETHPHDHFHAPSQIPMSSQSLANNTQATPERMQASSAWELPSAFLKPDKMVPLSELPTDSGFEWDNDEDLEFGDFQQAQHWKWLGIFGGFAFILGLFILLLTAGEGQEKIQKQQRELAYKEAIKAGDTAVRIGQLHRAYANYKQALKFKPNDRIASYRLRLTQLDLEADTQLKQAKRFEHKGQFAKAYQMLKTIDKKSTMWDKSKKRCDELRIIILRKLVRQIPKLRRVRNWKTGVARCKLLASFSYQHPLLRKTCPYIHRKYRRSRRRRRR